MRNRIIGAALAIICAASAALADQAGEYRVFTSKDGRAIEARIVEYDARNGKLKIERQGKGMMLVSMGALSSKDQAYVRTWDADKSFLSKVCLAVSADKKEKGNKVWYDLSLDNRCDSTCPALKIEYVVFIDVIGYGRIKDSTRVGRGWLYLEPLASGQKALRLTETFTMRERIHKERIDEWGKVVSQSDKRSEERMKGIWLKIRRRDLSGSLLTRNVLVPPEMSAEVEWPLPPDTDKKLESAMDDFTNGLDGLFPAGIGRNAP